MVYLTSPEGGRTVFPGQGLEEEAVEGEGEAGEERAAEAVACELEREADEDVARNHSHRPQRARRRPPPLPPGSTHHQRGSAL